VGFEVRIFSENDGEPDGTNVVGAQEGRSEGTSETLPLVGLLIVELDFIDGVDEGLLLLLLSFKGTSVGYLIETEVRILSNVGILVGITEGSEDGASVTSP